MASTKSRLDSLPVEIIKRIASCSPCESVLNLIKVNRKLYSACNDRLVFKSTIRNGNGAEFKDSWNLKFISETCSASDCARFALADFKARNWVSNQGWMTMLGNLFVEEEDPTVNTDSSDIIFWGPQLAALHHPMLAEIDLKELVERCETLTPPHLNERESMLFIITVAILHQGILALNPGVFGLSQDHAVEVFHGLDEANNEMSGRSERHPVYNAILFSLVLIDYIRFSTTRIIQPPSPLKIPFQSLMDVPLPFSKPYWSNCHLKIMTSLPFLEDGEWVGYYSYSISLSHEDFGPPMRGIRFRKSDEPSLFEDKGIEIGVCGTGMDNVGPFTLEGCVRINGEIRMVKAYGAFGPTWVWTARMTPFGIVGKWGRNRLNPNHGMFWLWKREWSVK